MMGTETKTDSESAAKSVVHISTDQMYVDEEEEKADGKDPSYNDPNNESATLDRAKEAAKEFV